MDMLHITRSGEGQHILLGGDVITIKAASATTADSMLIFEIRVPPGGGPPTLHRHGYSEVFYMLEGELEVSTLDADNRIQTATLAMGDTIAIPSMTWHTFKNQGVTPGRLLVIHSPPIMEPLIHQLGQPLRNAYDLPAPAGPPSEEEREEFMRIIGQYMEMLPPETVIG